MLHLNNSSIIIKDRLSCDTIIIKLHLYVDGSLESLTNTLISNASVDFILSSKRFMVPFYMIIIYTVNNSLIKL